MSQTVKYQVKIFAPAEPKKLPKAARDQLKGAKVSPKMMARMKKESVDCPIVKGEVAFLVCFSCPSFVNRVSGVVGCAGGQGPPAEWLDV